MISVNSGFFTIFAAVSPIISSSEVAGWQVWATFLLVFPFLNACALGFMLLLLPPSPPRAPGEELLEEFLRKHGFSAGKGAFAILLDEITQPSKLHLIDPWEFRPEYPASLYGVCKNALYKMTARFAREATVDNFK